MTDIDHLEIEITSNATAAEKAIAKLANSLKTLKAACQGGAGLNGIAKGVESLANAANSISSDAGTKLTQIANAISKISSAGYLGNTGLDKLAAAANGVNPASANAVAALANAVKPLASVGNVNLSGIASGLADIGAAADLLQGKNFSGLTGLAMAMAPLTVMQKTNLSNVANGLMDIAIVADLLQGKDMSAFEEMGKAIGNFKGISITKTFVTNFEKLIQISNNITPEMAKNLEQWANSLAQVGAVDLSSLANDLSRIAQNAPNGLNLGNIKDGVNKSSAGIRALAKNVVDGVNAAWSAVDKFVNSSNKYIEDVNLFTVSLGEYATQAKAYADRVSEVMGIDPGNWMRYQGIFQVLSEGFGVASDRAYIMSKNLTQLGYDLASFYNMNVEDAMLKLQSGLAGELEPLRRIGYDLSEARLKAIALSLGIKTAYKDMTQAEKSQLRYYAILTQVTAAQGDMARTLNAPANQLRILNAQLEMAGRAIGNIFIPALNAILPYAIAVVNAFRSIAEAIAVAFGFEMPTVDYSSVTEATTAMEELEETTTGTGKAAQKAKELLADWDELNIIASEGGSGSGTGTQTQPRQPDDWTWELPEYDFLGNAVESRAKGIRDALEPVVQWIIDNLNSIQAAIVTAGALFLEWKLAQPFMDSLLSSVTWLKQIAAYATVGMIVAISAVITYKLTQSAIDNNNAGLLALDAGQTALSSLMAGAIVKKLTGDAKAGQITSGIALVIDAAVGLKATYDGIKENGINPVTVLSGILNAVKLALGIGFIATALGMSLLPAVGLALSIATAVALIVGAIAWSKYSTEQAKDKIDWGPVSLTKDEIQATANDMFKDIPVKANIVLANNTVEGFNNAKSLLEKQSATFGSKLKLVKLGVDDAGTLENMLTALTGGASDGTYTEDSLLGQLKSTLDKVKETVEVGVSLMPPTNSEGKAMDAAEIVNSLGLSNALIQSTTEEIGKELATALSTGMKEGLDEELQSTIAYLGDWLNKINLATLQGRYESEAQSKLLFKLSDLDQKSFDGVVQAFNETATEMQTSYQQLAVQTKAALDSSAAGAKATYDYYLNDPRYGADHAKTKEAYDTWQKIKKDAEEYDPVATTEAYMETVRQNAWKTVLPDISELADVPSHLDSQNLYWNLMTRQFEHGVGEEGFMDELNSYLLEYASEFYTKEDLESLTGVFNTFGTGFLDLFDSGMRAKLYESLLERSDMESVNKFFASMGYTDIQDFIMNEWGTDDMTGFHDWFVESMELYGGIENWMKESMPAEDIDRAMGNAGKEAGDAFAKGMTGARLPTLVKRSGSNPDSVGFSWSIQEYAEGGQPVTGELFVAREAGPELVGSIGHKSTVMNNDQIVAGVAGGVAEGQAEQNELLRQQNAYLRIIAAKSGKVTLTPSSELGRVNKRSEEMRLRAEGV